MTESQKISRPAGLGAGTLASFVGQLFTHGMAGGGTDLGSTVGYAMIISIVVGGGSMYWYEKASSTSPKPAWDMTNFSGWALLGFFLVNATSTSVYGLVAISDQYVGFVVFMVGILSTGIGLLVLAALLLLARQFNRRRPREEAAGAE